MFRWSRGMIIDLRDYTTTPDCRDLLIERCETVLFPEQERLGADFRGIFRDADDPNRFVWLRAMPDVATRARVLTAFYTNGAMWKSQRAEVNRWIADSDNVLLVRPEGEWAVPSEGESVVAMYSRIAPGPMPEALAMELRTRVAAAVSAAKGRLLVTLVTDSSRNNYPRHPIRQGESGLIWFAAFLSEAVNPPMVEGAELRRLLPTKRSRMR